MKKVFGIAAMLLALAACNKIETEIQTTDQAEGITITAQLAPKTGGATTRAVSEDAVNNKIVSEWAENEHIAILYWVGSTKKVADATVTGVDGSGAATITFTVEAGTPDNTACTLVYPYSAAMVDYTTLLAAQDGTLNANLDVRVGAGTIQTTTPGLTVSTQPAAQFAIFKFTTKNSGGTATIDVKPLTITIGAQNYVITPASATSTLYAALPPISGEAVTFTATGSDSKTYTASKASVTFSAGKYYQSNIKLTEQAPALNLTSPAVGQVIGNDGKNYAANATLPTGVTKVAMIAYVSGSNGLAIALADEGALNWAPAVTTAAAHTPVFSNGTWKLPTQDEWKQMFSANGGNIDSYTGLNTTINTAGGTTLQKSTIYWSSSEHSPGFDAYGVQLDNDGIARWYTVGENYGQQVRACLAF